MRFNEVLKKRWFIITKKTSCIVLLILALYFLFKLLYNKSPWSFLIIPLAFALFAIWFIFQTLSNILTIKGTIFESQPFLNFKEGFNEEFKKDRSVILAPIFAVLFSFSIILMVLPLFISLVLFYIIKDVPQSTINLMPFFTYGFFALLISIRFLCQLPLIQEYKDHNKNLAKNILFFLFTIIILSLMTIIINPQLQSKFGQLPSFSSEYIFIEPGIIFFTWIAVEYFFYKTKTYGILDSIKKYSHKN